MLIRELLPAVAAATLLSTLCVSGADADVILADDFDDVVDANKVGNVATFGSWDTVAGIDAPASTLTFIRDDTLAAVSFHNVADGELDVNSNVGDNQPWRTSIVLDLNAGTDSIDLTSLVMDLRLASGNGGNNNTNSKSGRIAVILEGSTSGVLGTVDPGSSGYPSVEFVDTLDLSSLPTLDGSETYTLTIRAIAQGFGHHYSVQALELNGDITPVPEPSSLALLGLGGLMMIKRRRRA